MKNLMLNIILLSLTFATLACQKEMESAQMVQVEIRAVGRNTKSSMNAQEDKIENFNVYVYDSGVLYADVYSAQQSAVITLDNSKKYVVYALANVGEVQAPYREEELSSISCPFSVSGSNVLPMCLREGKALDLTGGTRSVDLALTRLVSKYSLNIKPLLEKCSVKFTSVKICQAAGEVFPFSGGSLARTVVDGDYADAEDLDLLNGGETVDFYIPENCQGVLLPANTDPWKKIPDSISGQSDKCTYMMIEGRWSTPGADASLCLRLYLGNDSTSDFNVVRNTNVNLTLSLSDDGTLSSSWKASLDDFSDERRLYFDSPSYIVYQEDGWTRLPLNVYPSDMTYYASVSDEQIEGSLDIRTSGGDVYVKPLYEGNAYPTATVNVVSWDGRQTAELEVDISYRDGRFTQYDARIPQCIGEYGYITFGEASDDVEIITSGGPVWNLDDGSLSGWQEYYDSASHDRLYLNPESRTLYIYRESAGGESYVSIRCFKSKKIFALPSSYKMQIKANDGFITESGCYDKTDSGQYYDSLISLYPAYSDGSQVSITNFRIPDELMEHLGLSGLESAYSTYEKLYSYPYVYSDWGSKGHYIPGYAVLTKRFDFYESTGKIAELRIFGKDDLVQDQIFTLTFKLAISGQSTTSQVRCIEAFPGQGFLGEVYNYQVAPGDIRSLTAAIPFSSEDVPSKNCTVWEVRHSMCETDAGAQNAFAQGSADIYSACTSVVGNGLSFTQMKTTSFPSCGHMALRGTVTNPYSKKTYTGYYSLDLVLYVSVGCQFDYIYDTDKKTTKLGVSYVPFCEFSTNALSSVWTDNMPDFLLVRSGRDSKIYRIKVPSSSSDNVWIISHGTTPKAFWQDAMIDLSSHMDYFKFTFSQFFNEGTELLCTREGYGKYPSGSEMQDYADGRMGYYHFVRQCDVANIPANQYNCGLDNYLIEAAYQNINKY